MGALRALAIYTLTAVLLAGCATSGIQATAPPSAACKSRAAQPCKSHPQLNAAQRLRWLSPQPDANY